MRLKGQYIILILILNVLAGISCSDSANNAGHTHHADSLEKNISNPPDSEKNSPLPGAADPELDAGKILANIEKYLVSSVRFDPPPPGSEGIRNGLVTVRNTLKKSAFERVMVGVTTFLPGGEEYRTDFHTIINIEPGSEKKVKLPDTNRGVNVSARVIKVKSAALTGGDWVITGDPFTP